ncbi:MAG: hypothetical protein ACD_63C00067G0004 [uncultured bacterium]|nr:MAG: hypothetical protein ACD_63C00067G0004 [uncultured bacterium]
MKITKQFIKKLLKKKYGFPAVEILGELETRGDRLAYKFNAGLQKFILKKIEFSAENKKRLSVLVELEKNDFPTIHIIRTVGGQEYIKDKRFMYFVYDFIEGQEGRPSKKNFFKLGQTLFLLHKKRIILDFSKFEPKNAKDKVVEIITKKSKDSKIKSELLNCLKETRLSLNRMSLVHSDPSFYNTIVSNGKIFLIDFDNIIIGPSLLDLSFVIVYMTFLVKFDFPKLGFGKERDEVIFYETWLDAFFEGYFDDSMETVKFEELWSYVIFQAIRYIYQEGSNKIYEWNYLRYKEILKNKDKIEEVFRKYNRI